MQASSNSISNVLHTLQTNQLSVAGFVQGLLNSKEPHHHIGRDSLLRNAGNICSLLYHQESAHKSVTKWAIPAVTKIICREVEMDLGEFGGHRAEDWEEVVSDSGGDTKMKPKKKQVRAAERNAALMVIKAVVCISIFLQNSNERCNYLQGMLGFFYHSTSVPEKVIETLAHAGLSISISSIHSAVQSVSNQMSVRIRRAVRSLQSAFAYDNFDIDFKTEQPTLEHRSNFVSATSATVIPLFGVNSTDQLRCSQWIWERDPRNPALPLNPPHPLFIELKTMMRLHKDDTHNKQPNPTRPSPWQEAFAWHVREILVHHGQHFRHFEKELCEPAPVERIPLHKTEQSTTDGNVEVMENLLRQGGIGDPNSGDFDKDHDIDMSEHVILVHGDLLTKERLDTVSDSRRIETTAKNRLQYVIFLPGLFHYKMACADALWPSMLDCWRLEAQSKNRGWTTLELFAASEPSWDTIVSMSHTIVQKYVACTDTLDHAHEKPKEQ
ncbi:hypothetical protein F4604DRAFT_1879629 [Suillus subluteus]|nr:hypothetical protein F4604DRAFT_1879629 [Suillus subluteus]